MCFASAAIGLGLILCSALSAALIIINADQSYLFDAELDSYNKSDWSWSITKRTERFYSDREDVAFVLLSLGVQNNQMNCASCIESLVSIGGWGGDIYLLSDRPRCLNVDVIIENANMQRERLHVVGVDGDFSSGGFDYRAPSVRGFRGKRLDSLSMKTRLFNFLPEYVTTIAYVDCDILFGLHGCPVQLIEETLAASSWDKAFIKFRRGFHAGSFIAHREHSKGVMHLWEKALAEMKDDGDNDAFIREYTHQETLAQLYNTTNPMATGEIPSKFELFFHDSLPPTCMTHISKARCKATGREIVQRFVNRLKLLTYEARIPYCPSSYVMPILYGSVSSRFLGCSKLETWL
jgi:hypothetical protein